MKKLARKLIASILALSMCSGILAVPAAAEEDGKSTTVEVTVDILDASGSVIGQQTTTTTTTPNNTSDSRGTTTTTQDNWNTSDTTTTTGIPTTEDKPPGGAADVSVTNPTAGTITTQTDTSVTVTTEGTQTSIDNVSTSTLTGTTTYSGTTSGSETTSTVGTTTTTTTVTNELLDDTTDPTAPQDTPVADWPTQWDAEFTEQGLVDGGEGEWIPDPSRSEILPDDQYTKVEGSEETPIENQPVDAENVDGIDQDKLSSLNPLDDHNDVDSDRNPADTNTDVDKAELSMSVEGLTYVALNGRNLSYEDGQKLEDGRVVTVRYDNNNNPVGYFLSSNAEDTLSISLEEILKYKDGDTLDDGSVITLEYEDDILVGYTITKKTPRADDAAPGEPDEITEPQTDTDSYGESTISHILPVNYTPPQEGPFVDEETGEEGIRTVTEITEKDAEGNDIVVGYEITEVYVSYVAITDGTSVTTPLDPEIVTAYTMPEEPAVPDPVTENGLTTTVTVEKIYENGEHVGYTTITTVTDESGNQVSQYKESIYRTVHSTTKNTEKTPNTETKTPTGQVVTRTVVKKVMGTQQSQEFTKTSTGTAADVNYQDVTQDLYRLVETDDGMYFLYKGTLYAVIDSSSDPTASIMNSGNLTGSYASGTDNNDLRQNGNLDIQGEMVNVIGKDSGDLYTNQNYSSVSVSDIPLNTTDDWTLVGSGMVSDFTVKETNGKGHATRMFKIAQKDANGNLEYRYVYCAELGENINPGGETYYGEHNYKTSDGCSWNEASGSIAELRSVALNGYWGTDSGIGSIEAVRDLMKRNLYLINQNRADNEKLTYDDIDALTPGMAIAATQVAIWNYTSSDNSKSFNDEFVYFDDGLVADYIAWYNRTYADDLDPGDGLPSDQFILADIINQESDLNKNYPAFLASKDSAEDKTTVLQDIESTVKTIVALRDLLVTLAEDTGGKGAAREITASSITEAGFIIQDKAANDGGTAAAGTDATGEQKYNTDVTFKLNVSTSSINGDLVVKVMVGDEVVGGGRLAGSNTSGNFTDFLFDKIYPDENGVYTIKDVELAEGVKVDLKLEGTQHLDDGVYIFENEDAGYQDFIGLSKLEKNVDIAVTMSFDVVEADPQFRHTQTKWVESKTDTDAFTKTDTYYQTKNGIAMIQYETVNTKTYGTTITVSTLVSSTKEHREWVSEYYYQVLSDGEAGENETGAKADVAKTGDITLALAAVSLFSASGLVALNWKKKED